MLRLVGAREGAAAGQLLGHHTSVKHVAVGDLLRVVRKAVVREVRQHHGAGRELDVGEVVKALNQGGERAAACGSAIRSRALTRLPAGRAHGRSGGLAARVRRGSATQ